MLVGDEVIVNVELELVKNERRSEVAAVASALAPRAEAHAG